MSALPKAVRTQVERANQLAKEYYESHGSTPPVTAEPPATTPPAEPPAGAPPSEPPAASTPPVSTSPVDWEARYKVLQGKYNAEVPRLIRQVQDLVADLRDTKASLTTTQNLLSSLGAQRGTAPAGNEPPAQPAAPARLVKDEEIKEFGADLYDFIKRAAREEQATLLPEIDRRVAPVKQRAEAAAQTAAAAAGKVAANDQQTVLQLLNEHVPKWQEQNEDQAFLEWLDQRDPFSGQTRGALLSQAYAAHDGPRVVNIFLGYQKEHAAVTPPPAATAPASTPAQPQRTLEQMVAPGTPKTGAASTPNGSGKRTWTRTEIGQFYKALGTGQYRTRADEARKLEADIFAAQREGRVTNA